MVIWFDKCATHLHHQHGLWCFVVDRFPHRAVDLDDSIGESTSIGYGSDRELSGTTVDLDGLVSIASEPLDDGIGHVVPEVTVEVTAVGQPIDRLQDERGARFDPINQP